MKIVYRERIPLSSLIISKWPACKRGQRDGNRRIDRPKGRGEHTWVEPVGKGHWAETTQRRNQSWRMYAMVNFFIWLCICLFEIQVSKALRCLCGHCTVTSLRSHRHQLTNIHLIGSRLVRSFILVKCKPWIAVVKEWAGFGTTNNICTLKGRKPWDVYPNMVHV